MTSGSPTPSAWPGPAYARIWARACYVAIGAGVVAALFRAPAYIVLVGVPLDTLVVALVYGLGALMLPGLLRLVEQHPFRHVVLRSLLVVSALVALWTTAAASLSLLLDVMVVVVASSPVVLRWADGHRPGPGGRLPGSRKRTRP